MVDLTVPAMMQVPRFQGERKIETTTKAVPLPGPQQLLVMVKANALCGSELSQFQHGSTTTPGHETAGIVVAAGSETHTPVGTPGIIYLDGFLR